MSALNPIIPTGSLSLRAWIKNLIVHPLLTATVISEKEAADILRRQMTKQVTASENDIPHALLNSRQFLKAAWIKTYGFDGYDNSTNKFIDAKGKTNAFEGQTFKKWLHISHFIGLPSRPNAAFREFPELSKGQLFKNILGGWKSPWSSLSLAQKGLVIVKPLIAVFKILLTPLKLVLNIVKLFTEFLPTLAADATAQRIAIQSVLLSKKWNTKIHMGHEPLTPWATRSKTISYYGSKFLTSIGHILLIALLLTTHTATSVVALVGRALTSPENSARMAWAYGHKLKMANKTAQAVVGFLLGTLGAALSVGLTVALWAIALPLFIGAIASFIPATLPLVNWFASLPLVATPLGVINGVFATIGSVLGAAFAPAVNALAGLVVGLQVPAEALALGVSLAVFAAPLGTILSRVADHCSDAWAQWKPGQGVLPLLNRLVPIVPGKSVAPDSMDQALLPAHEEQLDGSPTYSPTNFSGKTTTGKTTKGTYESAPIDEHELDDLQKDLNAQLTPRTAARQLAEQQQQAGASAQKADDIAGQTSRRVGTSPTASGQGSPVATRRTAQEPAITPSNATGFGNE